jgi:spiro-SPASM protein
MEICAILTDSQNIPENYSLNEFLNITVSKIREFTDDIYIHSNKEFDGLKRIHFDKATEFFAFLENDLQDKTVLILNAYSPLLDITALKAMLDEHINQRFDFTYPEYIPKGLLPEIIQSGIAEFIKPSLPKDFPMFASSVKAVFEADISSYDTNVYISQSRLIKYRCDFIPDSLNNYLATKAIIDKHGHNHTIESLEEIISSNPLLIRHRPTYCEIEITTERESGECFIGSRFTREGEIDTADFDGIISQIAEFAYKPVVMLGILGEPFLHTKFDKILETVSKHPQIRFIMESRGISPDFSKAQTALSLPNVEIIFDISSNSQSTFEKLKKPLNPIIPFEGLDALENKIRALSPSDRVYIQFTRTTLNENEIMKFHQKWKDYNPRIIIKKPDTFSGMLDKYRVIDLSPIKRFACLHLKHDLSIRTDGTVSLCREDFDMKFSAGNIISDGIETIWTKLGETYLEHCKNEYKEPSICKGCDEWWVFNF